MSHKHHPTSPSRTASSRRHRIVLTALASTMVLISCRDNAPKEISPPKVQKPIVRVFEVWKDGRMVMTVRDEPGPLVSRASPPPDFKPAPSHPFVSISSHDPFSEHQSRTILDQSNSCDDYLARMRAAGFEAKQIQP